MKTATKRTAANDPGYCPVRAAKMSSIFDKLAPCLQHLTFRWADEFEFEDIAEYRKVIEKKLAAIKANGCKITKMTKRPFGFECSFMGAKYRVKCGARSMSYVRIG